MTFSTTTGGIKLTEQIKTAENVAEQKNKCTPEGDPVRKRRAGFLVRMNLPPTMGERGAILDLTGTALEKIGTLAWNNEVCREIFPEISAFLRAAVNDTVKVLGMLNNPDTIAREKRLLMHLNILSELSDAFTDFSELSVNMCSDANALADEFDGAYVTRVNSRMAVIGEQLFAQLLDTFARKHDKISRYRDYAVKNLSRDNFERYEQAYCSVMERHAGFVEKISKII